MTVEKGSLVKVHYVGKFTDGEVFDSSEGREALEFQVGSGQIIPGFENAIIGKNIGDKVTATISPENGYGLVREDLIVTIPIDKMPGEVEVGQTLEANSEDGQTAIVVVKEVNEDSVVIDGNHPLSGKELVFEIEIESIQ